LFEEKIKKSPLTVCFPEYTGKTSYLQYSETCEIRTPVGRPKSVPNLKVALFQGVICTQNSSLGLQRCLYFTGCPHSIGLLITGFTELYSRVLLIGRFALKYRWCGNIALLP
jgi:hypothetical protein